MSRIGHGFGVSSVATALGGGPLPPGATQRVSVQSLLVLYGLPRLLCGSIVAHELTHAWVSGRRARAAFVQCCTSQGVEGDLT